VREFVGQLLDAGRYRKSHDQSAPATPFAQLGTVHHQSGIDMIPKNRQHLTPIAVAITNARGQPDKAVLWFDRCGDCPPAR
jgi:hypothetical protein